MGISERIRTLNKMILAAFPPQPFPDTEAITGPCVYDQDPERLEIADFFRGKLWTEPSVADLRYYDALALFSARAYRHFLPAYMRAVLNSLPESDTIPGSVVWSLRPGSYHDPTKFARRISGFTPQQREAIRAFLEWYRDEQLDDSAGKAIAEYWARE